MKAFTTYLLGMTQVNCFITHKKLIMYPLGKLPFAPSDDIVSARISTPTTPEIGRGRWAIPTRLMKNKTIKTEIQKLGAHLESQLRNQNPAAPNPTNPQTLLTLGTNTYLLIRYMSSKLQTNGKKTSPVITLQMLGFFRIY